MKMSGIVSPVFSALKSRIACIQLEIPAEQNLVNWRRWRRQPYHSTEFQKYRWRLMQLESVENRGKIKSVYTCTYNIQQCHVSVPNRTPLLAFHNNFISFSINQVHICESSDGQLLIIDETVPNQVSTVSEKFRGFLVYFSNIYWNISERAYWSPAGRRLQSGGISSCTKIGPG